MPVEGLAFDLLSSAHEPVTTGHADGLVTLDLAEADDARREARRAELGEPYRTVLGHLRHEAGHACFELLAPQGPARDRVRAVLGDERDDYGAALERHYAHGPPADWEQRHVSAYATMHPSEDWAETFAHVLHITDTLQTAAAYGIAVDGARRLGEHAAATADFDAVLAAWLPLSEGLNAVTRSMGRDDLYPFVLAPAVVEKLRLVQDLISRRVVPARDAAALTSASARAKRPSGARAATARASAIVSTSRSSGSAATRRPAASRRARCEAPVVASLIGTPANSVGSGSRTPIAQ